MPVPDDYSVEELRDSIRKRIVRAMVDEKQDEPALARVLTEAISDSDEIHIERCYHFPCVIVPYDEPRNFELERSYLLRPKPFQKSMPMRLSTSWRRTLTKNLQRS